MKIGNQYSDLLDNFTKNYGEMVKTIISEHHKYELKEASKPDKNHIYSDFLDKFAIQQRKNRDKDTIREQIFKFITTETNRDNHACELILRKLADKYKMKLTHYSGSFDYAAFQAIWNFKTSEQKSAYQAFDTIELILNGIAQDHNKTQKHGVSLVPIIRQAIQLIAESHQQKQHILSLDDKQQSESNWETLIYGGKYPALQEENKTKLLIGNHEKANIKRTTYIGRNTKVTKEI